MQRSNPYRKMRIEQLNRAELIQDDEDRWQLIDIDRIAISRVWLIGVITENQTGSNNYRGLKLEDGSGCIFIKSWDGVLDKYPQWSKIEVLGFIQISQSDEELDVFVRPNIVNYVTDDNWFLVHRLKVLQELSKKQISAHIEEAQVSGLDLGITSLEDLKSKLLKVVRELDEGNGVSFSQIVEFFAEIDEEQIDAAITELLESGEFFEPKAGIYSSAFDS